MLTEREFDVLILMANGLSNKKIADELTISIKTVAFHVGNILNKLSSENRTEAVARAINWGLLKTSENTSKN